VRTVLATKFQVSCQNLLPALEILATYWALVKQQLSNNVGRNVLTQKDVTFSPGLIQMDCFRIHVSCIKDATAQRKF